MTTRGARSIDNLLSLLSGRTQHAGHLVYMEEKPNDMQAKLLRGGQTYPDELGVVVRKSLQQQQAQGTVNLSDGFFRASNELFP
jgi:hypothetical protein